jgi:hypothetical protein
LNEQRDRFDSYDNNKSSNKQVHFDGSQGATKYDYGNKLTSPIPKVPLDYTQRNVLNGFENKENPVLLSETRGARNLNG